MTIPRKAKHTERKPKVNWRKLYKTFSAENAEAQRTIIKRDIAIADLNAKLREKDATISGLREIEGKLNARVGELERERDEARYERDDQQGPHSRYKKEAEAEQIRIAELEAQLKASERSGLQAIEWAKNLNAEVDSQRTLISQYLQLHIQLTQPKAPTPKPWWRKSLRDLLADRTALSKPEGAK